MQIHYVKQILKTCLVVGVAQGLVACGGDGADATNLDNDNGIPEINFAASDISVNYGEVVELNASNTRDSDGDELEFVWSGDVELQSPHSEIAQLHDLPIGEYEFTLTVSDGVNQVSDKVRVSVVGPAVVVADDLATGSVSSPVTVYYDLDSDQALLLDDEQAASNTQWDIAFNRTKIFLNTAPKNPVSLYFSGNVNEFYTESGEPNLTRFINATAATEFGAFESFGVDVNAVEFNTDSTVNAIHDFYTYDPINHTARANPNASFIVFSNDQLTKFRVTNIEQSGRGASSFTLAISQQPDGEQEFSEETTLSVQATACETDILINVFSAELVSAGSNFDIRIPCSDGLAAYEIHLAEGALALNGEYAHLSGISDDNFAFYPWLENQTTERAFVAHGDPRSTYGWGEYGVNGGHIIWPNFSIYVIQTPSAYYKFQVTSYYDVNSGVSGSYSIRYQMLVNE